MHIFEQPDSWAGRNDDASTPHRPDDIVVPAPVASVAHVSESDEWNPLVPAGSRWTPRGRRATHRGNGKH
jgi:hypothetical protein